MTRVKDNPMDESADPAPRPIRKETDKPLGKAAKEEAKSAKGKTGAEAFDAKNNNMTKKG